MPSMGLAKTLVDGKIPSPAVLAILKQSSRTARAVRTSILSAKNRPIVRGRHKPSPLATPRVSRMLVSSSAWFSFSTSGNNSPSPDSIGWPPRIRFDGASVPEAISKLVIYDWPATRNVISASREDVWPFSHASAVAFSGCRRLIRLKIPPSPVHALPARATPANP